MLAASILMLADAELLRRHKTGLILLPEGVDFLIAGGLFCPPGHLR